MLEWIVGIIAIAILSAVAFFLLDKKWADIVAIALGIVAVLLIVIVVTCVVTLLGCGVVLC